MTHIISATDREITTNGHWLLDDNRLRHAEITNHLNDFIAVKWTGRNLSAKLQSTTSRKIAVVAKLNNQPIPPQHAGRDIEWGEDQSYLIISELRDYQIVKAANDSPHELKLYTRSDKLICHSFLI